jgi:ABC-type transport system involved in cytochrome c biogenesis permease subunit
MSSDTLPDAPVDRREPLADTRLSGPADAANREDGEATFTLEPAARAGLPRPVYELLHALSSLKITIVLFALGIFIVLAGTVAQTKMGNWEAVDRYFRTFIAFVEFDVFAPKSFFPNRPDAPLSIPIPFSGGRVLTGFFFPGGWLIGACMLVNLLAAHVLRFKVQAKGPRLTLGSVVLGFGMLLTWLVVASGDNKTGVQGQLQDVFLDGLWLSFVVGLFAGLAGAVYGVVQLDRRSRGVEWWTSASVGALLAGVLIFVLTNWEAARLQPESMRILWQLVKASSASAVLLAGCIMVFKKRGGIVMLHAGIALLMLSELLVGMYAEEGQMTINEGETVNYAQDVREVELAFVETMGDEERHIVVPESRIVREGAEIAAEDLPFRIVPLAFYDNSNLRKLTADERAPNARDDGDPRETQAEIDQLAFQRRRTELPAEQQRIDAEVKQLHERLREELRKTRDRLDERAARRKQADKAEQARIDREIAELEPRLQRQAAADYTVDLKRSTNGLESEIDVAALRVELIDDEGRPLGQWLFSQQLKDQPVVVDGKSYQASLRFKRKYLPYSVHLIDIEKEDYVGTATPKDYSSYVRMVDSETGFERDDIRIWMNNPLRYRGQTLYQSDYGKLPIVDPETGRPELETVDGRRQPRMREYTRLSVVTNTGWMLPYVCCMIVAFGMFHQFGVSLLRFLGRKRRQSLETPERVEMIEYVPTALVLLIAVSFVAGMARPASTGPEELAVHAFGTLPVTSQGRVKPMDSLARNQLVSITDREGFKKFETDEDEGKVFNDVRVASRTTPAIVWMLDTITRSDLANDYPVFRVVNLDLIEDLGLKPRPGFFRYSFNEIWPRRQLLFERYETAKVKELDDRNLDERKSIELYEALQTYFSMQLAFRDVESARKAGQSETEYVKYLLRFGETLDTIALATPGEGEEGPWHSYAREAGRMWMREYAAEHSLDSFAAVARKIAEDSRGDDEYTAMFDEVLGELAELAIVDDIARIALAERPEMPLLEARQRAMLILKSLDEAPPEFAAQVKAQQDVAARALRARPEPVHAETQRVLAEQLLTQIPKVLGDFELDGETPAEVLALHEVLAAYREGDVPGFEQAIEEYRDLLASVPRAEYDATKVVFEAWFNGLAPFWVGQWLSILAFVIAVVSWLGWTRPLSWAAFWLMAFTLLLATLALVGRVYISGRPPVTNLYSSAVFIAWGGMVVGLTMEAIYRTGIGTAVAGAMGFLSLGIAHFLAREGDTIAVMQAVLDTNIWLATHVVCVTMGYATTFIAGFFGLWYVAAGLCTPALDRERERNLVKMIYGSLCFALFFSFVGTVLGGLWADDSWGRFWGWDPKENGALIIVLWNALVLHARWDGMVKDKGLAILAVAGNITTAWSWFGTNELRAGLHSYGFTDGVLAMLGLAVALHLVVIVVAACIPKSAWLSFSERNRGTRIS